NIILMIFRILEFFAFTSLIVALLSLTLALCTINFLKLEINYNLLLLIFFGTLTIYNIDHLRGLSKDIISNPKRIIFINKNLYTFYILSAASFVLSVLFLFRTGFKILPFLIIPFILGLVHRRLKNLTLFSAIYITISWVIITTILPSYLGSKTYSVYWLSLIIGIPLFCNAYVSTLREKYLDLNRSNLTIVLSVITIVIIISAGGNYISFLPFALITTLILLKYESTEYFELIYMDGSQLIGAIISLIMLNYVL
ncbi:MAG: hypothetical protein ACR2NW_03005, partial [Thermodesulfobacteriota bacterium]